MVTWLLANAMMAFGAMLLAPIWIPLLMATPRHRRTILRRLGVCPGRSRAPYGAPGAFRLWIHALSVGEVHAAQTLVKALLDTHPTIQLTFTASTLTGFQSAERLFEGRNIGLAYYPLDWLVSIRAVAKRIDPDAVILVETDIWPNFLLEMHRCSVPVYLVNMRLSDRAFQSYRRIKSVARKLLGGLDAICVQTRQDRLRLQRIGIDPARVAVTGNIKFDDADQSGSLRLDDQLPGLKAVIDRRKVIVAGSTHDGEEAALLSAMHHINDRSDPPLLILAPRNPDRSGQVLAMCEKQRFRSLRLSNLHRTDSGALTHVLVVDFIGVLKQLYVVADIAFIGGSLIYEGGHNPLEPAAYGKPVVFGPDMRDFHHIAHLLVAAGGAHQLERPEQLGPVLVALLNDSSAAEHMGLRARDVFLSHKGAVQRTLARLDLGESTQIGELRA